VKPLGLDSPRRVGAAKFGAELRAAMEARGVSAKRLAPAAGVAVSAVAMWKAGSNLPRTDTALRVAEVLSWPRLAQMARDARSHECVRCGTSFVNDGGGPKRFCSIDCRDVDVQLRARGQGSVLADVIAGELERAPGIRTRVLRSALDEWRRSDSKRQSRLRRSERAVETVRAAVAEMCAGCEPEGICRTPECPLRSVSPLPLALRPDAVTDLVRRAEGPHGPTHRAAWLASVQAGNARRWSRDGERERQAAQSRDRWAGMEPEERAAVGQRISEGRRRS
jgi:transcriptional regulator with XRE-family HTH domain